MKKKKLTQFSLNEPAILAIKKAASEELTQSEIMTRAACPRKWFYRYALMLNRRSGPNYHFVYGSLLHAALAMLYKSGHYGETYKEHFIEVPKIELSSDIVLTPNDRLELQVIREKVQIAFNAYRIHYYKTDQHMRVRRVEETYETKFQGKKLVGRIDMVAHPNNRNGVFIWDFKTAGRFDAMLLDAWSFRFQFLYYCWLFWRCTGERPTGTMVNGLAKVQLRPKIANRKTKEKETVEEYLLRVKNEMQGNREKYFYRQRMPLAKGLLERFENEMLGPHLDAFVNLSNDLCTNSLAMAMNTGQCHVYNTYCEYLPLCRDGPLMLAEYTKRDIKHIELSETEDHETD
jgi:hypothetical protein